MVCFLARLLPVGSSHTLDAYAHIRLWGLMSSDDLGEQGLPAIDTDDDLGPHGLPSFSPAEPGDDNESDSDLGPMGLPPLGEAPAPCAAVAAGPIVVAQPPPHPAVGQLALVDWLRPQPGLHAELAQRLSQQAPSRRSETLSQTEKVFSHCFGLEPRPASSWTAEASILNMDGDTFAQVCEEVAATTFHSQMMLTSGFLGHMRAHIAAGTVPFLAMVSCSFDESPMKMRVSSRVEQRATLMSRATKSRQSLDNPGAAKKSNDEVAKIFNSQVKCSFVLLNGSRVSIFNTYLPTRLQWIRSTAAECLHACLMESLESVAGLADTLRMFRKIVHLTCSDRAAPNLRLERMLEQAKEDKESRLRSNCHVHIAHTGAGAQFKLQPDLVSGLVNLSLVHKIGGSVPAMRQALRCLFRQRLRIVKGRDPPGPETPEYTYRESVLRLFLPDDLPRQMVIRLHLNGNWEDSVWIWHWCPPGCCEAGRSTIEIFESEVTEALLPHGAPNFPRHRWTQAEQSVDYSGLLAACGVLQKVSGPWLREMHDTSLPVKDADFAVQDDPGEEDLGPRGVLVAQALVGQAAIDQEQPEIPHPDDAAAQNDSHRHEAANRRARVTALEFSQLPALRSSLVTLRVAMQPHVDLMASLLRMSGEKWANQTYINMSNGGGFQSRFTQLLFGSLTKPYFESMVSRLFDAELWSAVPHDERTACCNLQAFQMLSRGAGCIEALLAHPSSCYPYRLFGLTMGTAEQVDRVHADPECVLDAFSKDYLRRYPTKDHLASVHAQLELRAISLMGLVDITHLETFFANIRRACLRSMQTWRRTVQQVAADVFMMRQRILQQGRFSVAKHRTKRGRKRRRRPTGAVNKQKSKRAMSMTRRAVAYRQRRWAQQYAVGNKKCINAWNLFWRQERSGLRGLPPREARQAISAKYRALSPETLRSLQQQARDETRRRRSLLDPDVAAIVREARGQQERPPGTPHEMAMVEVPAVSEGDGQCIRSRLRSLRFARRQAATKRAAAELGDRAEEEAMVSAATACYQRKSTSLLREVPEKLKDSFSVVASFWKGDVQVIDYHPEASKLAQEILFKSSGELRANILHDWDQRSQLIHRDPVEGIPPQMSTKCFLAGRCRCAGRGRTLRFFEESLTAVLRKACPPHSHAREAVRSSRVVMKLVPSGGVRPPDCQWLSVAWVNLNSFQWTALPLRESDDMEHIVRCAAFMPLEVKANARWIVSWLAFDDFDISLEWQVELWCLVHSQQLLPALCPAKLMARRFSGPTRFWTGQPPPPRRRPPRVGDPPRPRPHVDAPRPGPGVLPPADGGEHPLPLGPPMPLGPGGHEHGEGAASDDGGASQGSEIAVVLDDVAEDSISELYKTVLSTVFVGFSKPQLAGAIHSPPRPPDAGKPTCLLLASD